MEELPLADETEGVFIKQDKYFDKIKEKVRCEEE